MSNKRTSGYKLTDEQFLDALAKNGGLFKQTADYIQETYKIKYSRQSVRAKAQNFQEQLQEIKEAAIDEAEGGLMTLTKDEDARVRFNAIKYLLSTQAKNRNYTEKQEIDHTSGGEPFAINIISYHDKPNTDSTT